MLHHINHILLDAARMGLAMQEAKEKNPAHDSLYRGRSEESMSEVAPYIFQFDAKADFGKWYMEKGWGDSWGVMLRSPLPLQELHKHFRKFLLVKTEDGQELYFRFYDPRVLRIFLPTCDKEQVTEFFGFINYFLMEDEDPDYALRFWQENGILKTERLKKEELETEANTAPFIPNTKPVADFKPSNTIAKENLKTENPPQKKSKWNMFD